MILNKHEQSKRWIPVRTRWAIGLIVKDRTGVYRLGDGDVLAVHPPPERSSRRKRTVTAKQVKTMKKDEVQNAAELE